jgi:RNA polymerase sigma-70 factor (ECF subfamily)
MNHITKLRRDRHRFPDGLLDLLAEEAIERNEKLEAQRRALAVCIERLSSDERDLLAGCYAEGVTIRAFAERLGRSANVVYKQLNRVRAALLKCVESRLSLEGAV